ncbi:MAG: hypothetical protein FP826_02950 [Sphingomonadales bacterium]|nr:hypothetical protein [Sphingomonadales bacterium]MBU3992206.1 hypothetical protein [Alphaproteobacteria bacterium]
MNGNGDVTREERLAAKLRENLRRRKAQARAMEAPDPGGPEAECETAGGPGAGGDGGLSKERPSG